MVYSSVDGADGGSLFVPGRRYLVMGQFQGVMRRAQTYPLPIRNM